jgi:tetratricopeptide (TPR) repeat protein
MPSFVISPSDGFAGVLSETDGVVQIALPASESGRSMTACNYANRFPSSTVVNVASIDDGVQLFGTYESHSLALDFSLLLFDSEVSKATREEVASELERMLDYREASDYVLDILLASPLPESADVDGAIEAAASKARCKDFVSKIVESQSRVRLAYNAWQAVSSSQMVANVGRERIHGLLVHHGVFRRFVLEGKTQADKAALTPVILGVRQQIDSRISTALLNEYVSNLPLGARLARLDRIGDESFESDAHLETKVRSLARGGADEKRARAESQVEKIAELFGEGNDQVANEYLNQLVDSQTSDTDDHSHLVKSLCNIASKCVVRGRQDASFNCLTRALSFKNGIDSKLYLQLGHGLKDIREFDRALECYELARQIDSGANDDRIRLAVIRVSVAKGDYDNALTQYLASSTELNNPDWLGSIGLLYRRINQPQDARHFYSRALSIDASYHPARAGLAETIKQVGRHHKAIVRYQQLLDDFPELEEGSSKIYALARSHLFKVTHQMAKANQILTQLNQMYPEDHEVHLHLAKNYMLQGDTRKAKFHFERSEAPNLDNIFHKLFLVGIGEPVTLPNPNLETQETGVPPEEKGLVRCSRAIVAIRERDFEQAQRILVGSEYCDRLQSDFGAVLGYHATKMLDSSFNYKTNPVVARIAKRGSRELRYSVAAIAAGDFNTAQEFELKMCLRIA